MNMKPYLLLAALLFFPACFFGGVHNSGKVRAYEPGRVWMEKESYSVGVLSSDWKPVKIRRYKTASFHHAGFHSTISTTAFCDGSYEEANLATLTYHLHAAITAPKIIRQTPFNLGDRAALRTVASGNTDGVPMIIDTVVLKKDLCVFDFSLVSSPSGYDGAKHDFEVFFEAFQFQGTL